MRKKTNQRRGNILLMVFLLLTTVISCTALLKLSNAQMMASRKKAETVGQVNAYISIANICADTFRSDLEGLYWLMTVADLENMHGNAGYGLEIYDQAIEKFQTALTLKKLESGGWLYHLSDPTVALEYAGVNDKETLSYLTELLDGSTVTITIHNDLTAYNSDNEENAPLDDKGNVSIADIIFTVHLKRGAWNVIQTYRLSGEKMMGRFGEGQNKFIIDGQDAKCQLESQIVTKNNRNTQEAS